MKEQIIMAGSGGQGVLSAGKMIAQALVEEGKEIVYFPVYGSAVRGGTSNVTISVSDKPIACPVAVPGRISIELIFNQESLDMFVPYLRKDGLLLYNTSLIKKPSEREDIRCVGIPANALAEEAGNVKSVNMIMLGALIGTTRICSLETMCRLLNAVFTGEKAHLANINRAAIETGLRFVQNSLER